MDNPSRGALTGLPLRRFDIVLASISYELDIVNLVKILYANDLNPVKRHRSLDDPLIIVGGLPPTANPLPFSVIADGIFIGDGEVLLELIVNSAVNRSSSPSWKANMLDGLSRGSHLFTGSEASVKKAVVSNLDNAYHPVPQIRSELVKPVYGDGFYVEVSRGCRWLCPYCLESFTTFPPRYRSFNTIKSLILKGLQYVNERRVIIYSLSFFDHPSSDELLNWLLSEGIKYSLPSLRYTTLNVARMELVAAGGQRTITIAPETVDVDVSCAIRKCFLRELVYELSRYALLKDMNVKLYFIFGLPGEGVDIGRRTAEFINEVTATGLRRSGQVRVSVNPFIPKPNTAMQYFPLPSREVFERKVKELLRNIDRRVRVSVYNWKLAFAQALIALGDENAGYLSIEWALKGGKLGQLKSMLSEIGYSPRYVFSRKELGHEFPWSSIDLGVKGVINKLANELLALSGS